MHYFGYFIDGNRIKLYDLEGRKRVCGRYVEVPSPDIPLTIPIERLITLLGCWPEQYHVSELSFKPHFTNCGTAGCVYYDHTTNSCRYAPTHTWQQVALNAWRFVPVYE